MIGLVLTVAKGSIWVGSIGDNLSILSMVGEYDELVLCLGELGNKLE